MGKELKHLNRKELIEIIYRLKKSEQELQAENEQLRKQLEGKRITLSKAGSVADAAMALTDVFSTAQAAADVYLDEIEQRRKEIKRDYKLLINDAHSKSEDMIRQAAEQRDEIVDETKKAYALLKKIYGLLKKYDAEIERKKLELSMLGGQE